MSAATIRRIERTAIPRDTVALARYLLGKLLVRESRAGAMLGRIVETEAYLTDDPACHAYRGMTPRNRSLFLDAGHAYVYLCYGTHHLLNVSSEAEGVGCGVLLRALEPVAGAERMRRGRRSGGAAAVRTLDLARGPGRLTAALGIDLFAGKALWIGEDGTRVRRIGRSTRIGLTRGAEAPLRFFVRGSRCLSGPRRLNA